jgi:hypothetical protein
MMPAPLGVECTLLMLVRDTLPWKLQCLLSLVPVHLVRCLL